MRVGEKPWQQNESTGKRLGIRMTVWILGQIVEHMSSSIRDLSLYISFAFPL